MKLGTKMNTKQWIVLVIWFVCYITCMQLFRFKFGIFRIAGFFVLVGIPVMVLLGRPWKPKS